MKFMSFNLIKTMADKNKIPNCLLLYGNEEYFIDYSIKYIKGKYVDESYESMNYAEFEKSVALNDYFEFAETSPFMAKRSFVS